MTRQRPAEGRYWAVKGSRSRAGWVKSSRPQGRAVTTETGTTEERASRRGQSRHPAIPGPVRPQSHPRSTVGPMMNTDTTSSTGAVVLAATTLVAGSLWLWHVRHGNRHEATGVSDYSGATEAIEEAQRVAASWSRSTST